MLPVSTHSAEENPSQDSPSKRNRPLAAAELIKEHISAQGIKPGDRLPQEHELIEYLQVSKGTVREALKVLETQGLIRTRTGPGGGAFIKAVETDHAVALLANHFFFKELTIGHIYELRIALEPELVAGVATVITPDQIAELTTCMKPYSSPPSSKKEERAQRVAELEFHQKLAGFSQNPLLSFTCHFLVTLLRDLTLCRKIYNKPNPQLRKRGLSYQEQLIYALEAGDAEEARSIMRAHMKTAQRIMLSQEAEIMREFLVIR